MSDFHVEEIYEGRELIGTITHHPEGFEIRGPNTPTSSTTGWTRYETRADALTVLRLASHLLLSPRGAR